MSALTIVDDSLDAEMEASIARDPYDVEIWLEYAADKARRGLSKPSRAAVFERALVLLPGSYKLWFKYLSLRLAWIAGSPPAEGSARIEAVNQTFERALVYMNKMPRIWIMYCGFLVEQRALTKARRAFDRALQSLPSTQHAMIWEPYGRFALHVEELPWQTAERILRRRITVDPSEGRAALVAFLRLRGRHGEAARELHELLVSGKSAEQTRAVRLELCALVSAHPDETKSYVDLEALVREGLRTATKDDDVERLWTSLGDYCIRLGEFDRARDVFEEAMSKANTVKLFSALFDAYSRFEEALLDSVAEDEKAVEDAQFTFRLARLDNLAQRRALLLSSTLLRGGDLNNVGEWLTRAALLKDKKDAQAACLERAIDEIKPKEAFNGRPSSLWMALARLHDGQARSQVLNRATQHMHTLKDVVDAVRVWTARIEDEIEHGRFAEALALAVAATTPPPQPADDDEAAKDDAEAPTASAPKPHRALRLWNLRVDLTEVASTFESTRAAYDLMMQQKICTPITILNYTALLREHDYYEDSFTVFERAVGLFPWPHALDLWVEYAQRFIERYGGSKVERMRDLFEQALGSCPADFVPKAAPLFYLYAKFEEKHGLARRAMQVYERMCLAVPLKQRMDTYLLWARSAQQAFGAPSARVVFERAIKELDEKDAARVCLRYADAERRLGEMERARAVYQHASQFVDPSVKDDVGLWDAWKNFEVAHGSEDTFRDMLRVKRSVAAHFSVLHQGAAAAASSSAPTEAAAGLKRDAAPMRDAAEAPAKTAKVMDPSEIALDDDDDDIEQVAVPAGVFGGVAMGALERLKTAAS